MDPDLFSFHSEALGLLLAAAIGFLTGRTREAASQSPRLPKPGIRDFIILALTGGICAFVGEMALTVAVLALASSFLFLMRMQQKGRHGVTTELAALATFLLGYLCLTKWRPLAMLLGIVLAMLLAEKEELKAFSLKTISHGEFRDTLKFLALIFVIHPLLPQGGYGPFEFFEPRKIWFFVILVSGVSYTGYFLTKFLDARRSIYLTAMLGGLASTTAYTGAVSKVVSESLESPVSWARAVLLSNSILFPRTILIAAAFSPELAWAALVPLGAMTLAGFAGAWLFCRNGKIAAHSPSAAGFKNPFALGPALKFGLAFTVVLFLVRAGKHYWGESGQWVTSGIGGLVDVDSVLVSQVGYIQNGSSTVEAVVPLIILASATNAIFKSVLAFGSRRPAFYLRVLAGFAMMFLTGALVEVFWG